MTFSIGCKLAARYAADIPLSLWERGLKETFSIAWGGYLLIYSDPDDTVPLTLEELEDLAGDEDTANGWKLQARYTPNIPLSLWERG